VPGEPAPHARIATRAIDNIFRPRDHARSAFDSAAAAAGTAAAALSVRGQGGAAAEVIED